ncbi:MAG: Hsp20/alpha crystallin family protein [Rectinemataceae bacterium]
MSYHDHFGNCFEGFKNAARDFGDIFKDMAEDAGWRDRGSPFDHAWSGRGEHPFADYFYPRANVFVDEDKSLVFEFLLPGFDESSIKLSFKGDTMVLEAEAPERTQRRYEIRRFTLRDIDCREYPVSAERYDQSLARASHRNGILTVSIPRREGSPETEGIRVEIRREGS